MNAGVDTSWQHFVEAFAQVYRDPLLTGGLAGMLLGFLGVYVVLRRMVFISAALSQVSAAGVASAFYLGANGVLGGFVGEPTFVALALSLLSTFFLRLDPARVGLSRDALLGLVYAAAGALTLALGTRIPQEAHDLHSILFGTGVAVRQADLTFVAVTALVLVTGHSVVFRGLAAATFDPVGARVQGLPVRLLETFLFFSIAVAVAVTTRALGALPVFGFTVLPAMAALALLRRLGAALVVAAAVGALSGVLGYVYAYFARLPVGAAQVLVAALFAAVALGLRVVRNPEARPLGRVAAGLGAAVVLVLCVFPLVPASAPAGAPGVGDASPAEPKPHHAVEAPALRAALVGAADPEARAAAARGLAELHNCGCAGDLVRALSDADWEVRAEAAEALGHVAGPEREAALSRALATDDSRWVRSAAAAALTRIATPAARRALEAAAREAPHADARAAAAAGLRRLVPEPPPPGAAPSAHGP